MDKHPQLKNMESAIRNKKVTEQKIDQFKKWMSGAKFPEELREEAEKLLEEAEQLFASGDGAVGYQVPQRPVPGAGRSGVRHVIQVEASNRNAGPASAIGAPFHNPYTFIPFPVKAPERHKPTPLTVDEVEKERMTGVLSLKLKTLSPLLIPAAVERQGDSNVPVKVPLQKIGKDVVVPATSVRGVLRSLCAIISESALDYVDDELWLCQGRDLSLDNPQKKFFLAEVLEKGDRFHDGLVRVGEARLVKTAGLDIEDRERPLYVRNKKQLWIDKPDSPRPSRSDHRDDRHPFRVKVSGRRVNQKGTQHEGAFRPDAAREITLRRELWLEFTGRHRNAEKKELSKGDLVWLEAYSPEKGIREDGDVKSIQWARWGREGDNFKKLLETRLNHMLPDSIRNDGLVDITSDLFGCIPIPGEGEKSFPAFAARIRPENLIFRNPATFWNNMAIRATPHPGCRAFYASNSDYDAISSSDLPRGYKVYRTTRVQNDREAPWKYENQPIFKNEKMQPFAESGRSTTCNELLKADSDGTLKIAYRALTRKEFALLLLVLSCDLRIGGGKPFGLGHCRVTDIAAYDEAGECFLEWTPERAHVPETFSGDLPKQYAARAELYCRTQEPVSLLRYPRAINRNQRGGMCWFGYFAAPKKDSRQGLQTVWTDGALKVRAGGKDQIKAQALPVFDPHNPESDLLYGYDLSGVTASSSTKNKNVYQDFVPFSGPNNGPKYSNQSPNRETRKEERHKR